MVDTTGYSREEAPSLRLSEVESINGLAGMIPNNDDDDQSHGSAEFASSREDVAVRWLRLSVISLLVICAVGLSVGTFLYLNTEEKEDFDVEFDEYARVLTNSFNYSSYLRLWTADSLASAYTSQIERTAWPNATLRDFGHRTLGLIEITKASVIIFAPLVSKEQRPAWENYAIESNADALKHGQNVNIFVDGVEVFEYVKQPSVEPWNVAKGISHRSPNGSFVPATGDGPFFPVWQVSNDANHGQRMMDVFALTAGEGVFTTIDNIPGVTTVLFFRQDPNATVDNREPYSFLAYPVFDSFREPEKRLVGLIILRFNWVSFFENILPDHAKDIDVVLRNSCGQEMTFRISGSSARYVSSPEDPSLHTEGGDFHDKEFDDFERNFVEQGFNPVDHSERRRDRAVDLCKYEISVYPTKTLRARYQNDDPALFAVIVGGIFIFCILVFIGYDYLVRRRHTHVVKAAERSNAIVHNLFPAIVRDRVITDNEKQGGGMLPWRRRRASQKNNSGNESGGASSGQSLNHTTIAQLQAGDKSKFLPILNDNQKARLKTFLASDAPSTEETADDYDSEPIAELFNSTTVMFADIAGFTAWSSEREPSQVFYLLETLYRAFDNVASRLGVFKVETIGDCYVAVAGLPDPNEHHALIMTWFAYECLRQMKDLIKELEIQLGPGTSDLALRVGLHSGPVIAGVLRGEKSRFQLFGDTMNTAARMESTGDKNLIHASDDTAKLLQDAGKTGWITPREGVVYAKGKGEMQTYWLKPRRGSSRGASSYNILENSSCSSSTIDSRPKHNLIAKSQMAQTYKSISSSSLPNAQVDSKRWGNLSLDEALATKTDKSDIKRAVQKRSRLVDWNVELLTSFIAKIVAYRNQNTTIKLRRRQSLDKVARDSCRILEEVTEIIALPDFDSNNVGNKVEVTLPPAVRSQLHEYVTRIAAMYPEHPFHNLEHASHVTMSAVKLMKRIINPDDIEALENNRPPPLRRRRSIGGSGEMEGLERNLYDVTFGISSDPLTQFCVVFSALIHDVDHRGVPNAQLVQEGHEIAKKFGEKSAAEQNSVYIAWEMLMEPRYEQLRSCIYTTDDERRRFRQLVVNAVMATDIMDKDLQNVRKNRWKKAFNEMEGGVEQAGSSHDRNRKATSVIEHVIQASDVAHTMQHWHIFRRWNERLFDEMYVAYKSGKTQTDPSVGWYEGQISFFDFYIIPLAQKLKECGVFGVAGDEYLSYARENRREWVEKGKEETEVMMVNFNLRYGFWSEGSDDAAPNEGISKIEEEGELLENSGQLEESASERTIQADFNKRDII